MKNLSTRLLFFLGILVYLSLLGNRSGSPAGRTGAPGESTCASSSCHSGTANSGSATINVGIDDGATAYVPGQTHKISISISSSQAAARNGFEIVALDAQDNNIGEWSISGDDKRTRSANGRDYVTHNSTGSGQASWEMDWVAPSSDAGAITFYVAVNDANNNGGRSGDNIYTTSLDLMPEVASSVTTINSLEDISVFPNPVKENLNIDLTLTATTVLTGTLINATGQTVSQLFHDTMAAGKRTKSVQVPADLAKGYYFLKLESAEGGVKSIPILKE